MHLFHPPHCKCLSNTNSFFLHWKYRRIMLEGETQKHQQQPESSCCYVSWIKLILWGSTCWAWAAVTWMKNNSGIIIWKHLQKANHCCSPCLIQQCIVVVCIKSSLISFIFNLISILLPSIFSFLMIAVIWLLILIAGMYLSLIFIREQAPLSQTKELVPEDLQYFHIHKDSEKVKEPNLNDNVIVTDSTMTGQYHKIWFRYDTK